MKVKRLLVILLSLVLLIGSVFAVGISADETATPGFEIVSKNVSYDGDLKLIVAIPKDSFDENITLTVEWTENTGANRSVVTEATASSLATDGISDPTINGVECYAVMAKQGVSAKDMGTELNVTVSATKDGAEVTYSEKYSVLQYVYTKLYENEILYAEDGTPNAARRALYLSTIKFAKAAEKVLYDNLTATEDDNLETHADEWIYSDLEGSPKLYKPGETIKVDKYTKLLQYTLQGGVVDSVETFVLSGEIKLSAAVSLLENPDKTETFDEGIVDTEYITPNGGSIIVDTVDGNKVLASTSESGSINVHISDREYDRNNANNTYVFNTDFHLDAGEKIGDISFCDAEGNVVYTLSLDTAKATYYSPEAKQNTLVSASFAESGWHTLKVELYQNNRVKVYVDGTCYLGYIDGTARAADLSALSYATLSLANAKYDNVGFSVCDVTFAETNFAADFENGNVQDSFGKLAASGTAFSLASDLADKADTALKVAISGSEAENSTLVLSLTNEDPQGSLYVFEMDIKGTSYTNTGDRALMALTFGDDANNKFYLYNKYGSNNNYGKGMSFGLGGRNILTDVYTYNAATDTSYVLTYNEWYTLRLELDLGATPEVRVLVRSSQTGNKMLQVASITVDGTTTSVPGATRTPAVKLNTKDLVNVDSVNLSFNKVNASTTYIDNLSFIRTTNVADGEIVCDHSTMGAWENVVAASCTVTGEDVRRCACGNAACDYVETRQLDKLQHSEGVQVPRKEPTCISTGYEAYIGCPNCFEITEGEFIVLDKIPHNLVGVGAIVDNKQDLACNAGECGIKVEDWIVASAGNGVLNFTDYAITERVSGDNTYYDFGDGNAYIAGMSSATLDASEPSVGNPYVTYSVTGDGALKVQTVVANYNTYKGPALYLKTTNTNPSGTKYALDFDIYAEHSMTDNTSRVLTQLVFGGNVISLMTYGTNVCIYGASSKVLGAANEWISVRVEYTVTSDGNGTAELIVKDNDGLYRTVHTTTLSGSAIKVAGVSSVYISSFSTDINHTYYLDNLSLIRVDTNCYHMDGEDYRVDSWTETKAPTCTTLGEKQGICTVCGETVTVEIPMISHIESDWIIDTPAGCVTDGSKHKECTVCHTVLATETISASGDHDIGGWTEVDGGYKKGCANCDTCDEYTETLSGGVVHFNDGTILAGGLINVTVPGGTMNDAGTEIGNTNTTLSIVNNVKEKVNNVLKVCVDSTDKNVDSTSIKVNLADENATGNLLVFEMDFGIWNITNSSNVKNAAGQTVGNYLFNVKIGNNNFQIFPQYGDKGQYGSGINIGIGGRNILSGEYNYAEDKDNAFLLPSYEWNAIRLEIDVDAGELKTFVKSSATSGEMMLVATTTATGTVMESITSPGGKAVTRTSSAKLNTTGLADVKSAEILIHENASAINYSTMTGYLDNLSFNIFDTRCYHENITEWNETVAPDCITEGEKQAVCPDCGETIVETVPALGHELVDVDGKDATCTEPGYTAHKACSRCDYTEGYEVIEALDHTESEWIVSIPVGCFTDGEHYKICTVCGEEIAREPIVATGHTFGAWTDTDDANTEKRTCDVCGRYQLREKNTVIDFSNGAILDDNGKLSVTVGALTGTGDASVDAAAGLTAFGNARFGLSLADDVTNKVLKIVATNDQNYGASSIKLYHTDATRVNADRYVVFEFDVKFDYGTSSTAVVFEMALSDSGNNKVAYFNVMTYKDQVKVDYITLDTTKYVADNDNGTWITFRMVTELATEQNADGNYYSYTDLYVKPRDSEEPMQFVKEFTGKSTYTGHTERSGGYNARINQYISQGVTTVQNYYLDNLSLIRTDDANYTYSACDHAFDEWNITAPDCDTDGVATRSCTNDGCGYVETEYIPALGHELSDWTDAANNTQVRTCANCDYVISRIKNENAVQFDDGTLLDGGKVTITHVQDVVDGETVDVVIDADDTEGGNPYVWYSVVAAPGRLGETALKIQTVKNNYVDPYKGPRLNVTPVNEGATGNVYTLDFAFYSEHDMTDSTTRNAMQLVFGSSTINVQTYGTNIKIGGYVVGAKNTWLNIRVVTTVIADANATAEIFVANAEGVYTSLGTVALTTGIKLDGTSFYFSSYSSGMDHTYYLDNIHLTRESCNHVVNVWNTTVQPTCTVEGEKQGTCTLCGETVVEAVEALGHELADVAGQDATCTEPGYTAHKACSRCDYIEGKNVIDALGHTEATIEAVAPDCTNTGLTEGVKCSVCDEILVAQQPVDALGHTDGEWITDVDATCDKEGSKHQVCAVCGETIANGTIPTIAHTFGAWADAEDTNYEERQCSVCDRIQRREKNTVIDSVIFPADSTTTRVDFTDSIHTANLAGGKYLIFDIDVVLNATASQQSVFEIRLKDDTNYATGNNWITYYEIIVNGSAITVKTVNGASTKTLDTAKYVANGENSITFRMVGELATEKTGDNYLSNYTLYVKNTDSDEPMDKVSTYQRSGGSVGHTGRSGNYLVLLTKLAGIDNLVALNNASFIRTDDTNYLHSDCAHEMSSWTIDPASCTAEGVATRSCECGYVETEYIPALGHNITYSDPLNNKCTVSCTNGCGYVLNDWIVVPNTNAPIDFEDNLLENESGHLNIGVGGLKTGMTGTVTDIAQDKETGAYPTEGGNDAIWYSLASNVGGRVGSALKIETTGASRNNFNSGRMDMTKTDAGNAGDIYVFEFDTYIDTLGSGSIAYQYVVLGQTINVYGRVVDGKAVARLEIGSTYLAVIPQDEWVSLRFEIYFPAGQEATNYTLKVFEKSSDTEGRFESQYSGAPFTAKNSNPLTSAYISNYFSGSNVVYLDNISFARVDTSCQHTMLGAWEQTVAPTCTTAGEKQAVCETCGETVTAVIDALGHTEVAIGEAIEPTCTTAGSTAGVKCSACQEILEEQVTLDALGHSFSAWAESALDANYEERLCANCGRIQSREKNFKITFENNAILDSNGKLAITVGALTGTGDASVSAAAGLTAFGNARLSLSLVDDVDGKVLKVIQTQDANYAKTTAKIYHTDATRSNDDKYVVAEFDLKANKGTNSTRHLFIFTLTDNGSNTLYQIHFQNYNGNLKTNTAMIDAAGADGKTWYTIRIVTELADEMTHKNVGTSDKPVYEEAAEGEETHYMSVHKVYVKERDAEGPMTCIYTYKTYSTYTGNTTRTGGYLATITEGNGESHTFFLDNISLIRTSDANYTYSACDHAMGGWSITDPDCTTRGTATRKCTNDGCGYTETEYIPALGHDFSEWTDVNDRQTRTCANCGLTEDRPIIVIVPTVYGDEYLQASGDMGTDTKLVAGKADINTNKHLIFTAQVDTFSGLRLGHGYADYTSAYLEIDGTTVKYYWYTNEHILQQEETHGLDISGILKVTIDVNHRRVATVTIEANGESFQFSTGTNWYGSNGEIFAESLGSTLYGAQLAFTCDGYEDDIQFYGDSYLSQGSTGWLKFAFDEGHTDGVFDGFGGRSSGRAIASLIENLKHSTPKTVVWMLGMNDGSDLDINTPSNGWATGRDRLIALSKEYGFEIIFTTIPTVPGIYHEGKNKWIRESGYRYIDMAAGLGADGTGAWTEGYLSNDNVHPSVYGAEAIYNQVALDFPELVGKCYHSLSDWTTTPPTCTDAGEKSAVCQKCGETVTETIEALGHTEEDLEAVAPDCTNTGLTAGVKCSVCDAIIEEQQTIDTLPHTFDAWVEAADANYEERQCSVCKRIQRQEKNTVIASPELKTDTTYYRFDFTDAIHTANVAGGKYLVFDVDVVLKSTEAYTRVFEISIMDDTNYANGNNWITYYEIIVNGSAILVKTSNGAEKALDTAKYVANGENSITFRVVGELATEKTGDNYLSNYTLYVKNTDSDEPMDKVSTYQRSGGSVGHTGRSGNYLALINTKTTRTTGRTLSGEYLASVANASFIRTDDTNYLHSDCAHTLSAWETVTNATCLEEGKVQRSCECGYVEYEYIPALGHALTDWTDAENNTQTRTCQRDGCGYVISRVKNENAVQFDDGTLLSGGKISFSMFNTKDESGNTVSVDVNETTTAAHNNFISYAVVDDVPGRTGETALKVSTILANRVSPYSGVRLNVATTDGSDSGNVYTVDFDIYAEAEKTDNSSRIITQLAFGGSTVSIMAYGTNVRIYGTSINLGAIRTWISLRVQYTVTADGSAAAEVFVKAANGTYNSVYTTTVTGSAITVAGVSGMYFSDYATGMNHTYYLDNISFIRT